MKTENINHNEKLEVLKLISTLRPYKVETSLHVYEERYNVGRERYAVFSPINEQRNFWVEKIIED